MKIKFVFLSHISLRKLKDFSESFMYNIKWEAVSFSIRSRSYLSFKKREGIGMNHLKWYLAGILAGCIIYASMALHPFEQLSLQSQMSVMQYFPANKKTITIGRSSDAISLDPAITTDRESLSVTTNIYDTLVKYDLTGMNIKPGLASRWSVSEDGLIWRFNIRRDISFQDGTPLNAKAIVFNFERWKDVNNPYHTGHFTYWNMSFGGFPGIVNSVQALSDDVVEITLNKPYAPFLTTLAMPAFGIASPEAITKYNEDLKYKPVGTGPFVFKSWTEDGVITLEKNLNYWDDQAKVDRLVFKTITQKEKRIQALLNNEIQIAYDLSKEEVSQVKYSKQAQLVMRPYFNVGYLSMNTKNPYMYEKSVRQAIAKLIDKDAMIKEAFDYSARPADTFLPPMIWGYNETIESPKYSVEEAKALLASVGLQDGFKLDLLVMDEPRIYFPEPLKLANFIKKSLAKANIDVQIQAVPWQEVIKIEQSGDYDMVLAGWSGDVADPDNFLYTMFSSDNASEGVVSNYAYYKNPIVDRLLIQARQSTDKAFRISLYRKAQEIIAEDSPAIPLVHTMPAMGVSNKVIGYIPQVSGVEPLTTVNLVKEK